MLRPESAKIFLTECLDASRGQTITTYGIAIDWLCSLGMNARDPALFCDASRLIGEAADELYAERLLDYTFCRHAMHSLHHGPCRQCGAAIVATGGKQPSRRRERQRIWVALCGAGHDGLTREEMAARSRSSEKTVCWACRDWAAEGLIERADFLRVTAAGRRAGVIRVVCN